jgi:hypothetical protein
LAPNVGLDVSRSIDAFKVSSFKKLSPINPK